MTVMTTGEHEGRRTRAAWVLAATLTVVGAGLLPLLQDPRYYFYGDTQAAYYGWWFHLGQQVREGAWPILDLQSWRAGNFIAEGQWGLFSPLVIGIGLLATATGNVLLLATVVKLALILTGALGVFALVRSYQAPSAAAYIAAVAAPMGGMTQYLELPSWAAGLMIWALLPWVWWAIRRTMLGSANPFPALFLGYLLVTVGYVYGTIMLILVILACLLDTWVARDKVAALRVFGIGVVCGLVAAAVYLPGILSVGVTVRGDEVGLGGFGGKFTTDPLAMFTSVLPTASVHGTSLHLRPYAYAVWFLPVLLWLDFAKLRKTWRPLAGLFFVAVVTLLVVDGPSRLGPLRWPLRLQTFLVQMLVVLCVVLVSRYVVRRPSRARLGASLVWVLLAGVVAVFRAPGVWTGHLVSVAVVGLGLALLWRMLGADRRPLPALAAVAGAFTIMLFVVQHLSYPAPPSPERNMPARVAGYQQQLPEAAGDVMLIGDQVPGIMSEPAQTRDLLAGSAWYLNPHPVQNTYTTISFRAYYDRYCINYIGATCPEALDALFSTEPTTGKRRVDLLSLSTLLLVRADFPDSRLQAPPAGWHVAGSTRWSVTWVRGHPVPTAGGPVWASDGTAVSQVSSDDRTLRLQVGRVPVGGGRVVLSRLAWPGYDTDTGHLADPVDDYLVTLDLPESAAGKTVTVHFSPPGWALEVTCWWIGVLAGLGWSVGRLFKRRLRLAHGSPTATPRG